MLLFIFGLAALVGIVYGTGVLGFIPLLGAVCLALAWKATDWL